MGIGCEGRGGGVSSHKSGESAAAGAVTPPPESALDALVRSFGGLFGSRKVIS